MKWYAVYTKPQNEFKVNEILQKKEVEVFLPTILRPGRSGRKRVMRETPLFRSYIFVKVQAKTPRFYSVLDTPGVMYVVGNKEGPVPIPDREIESLKILVDNAREDIFASPYLAEGDRVLIIDGPLKGAEGVLVKKDRKKYAFVVNIHLLGRSCGVPINPEFVKKI